MKTTINRIANRLAGCAIHKGSQLVCGPIESYIIKERHKGNIGLCFSCKHIQESKHDFYFLPKSYQIKRTDSTGDVILYAIDRAARIYLQEKPELKLMAFGHSKRSATYSKRKRLHAVAPAPQVASQSEWFQKYAGPAAEEVRNFCKAHEIVDELKNSVSLAEKCFWSSPITIEVDTDPETSDRKIVLRVSIHGKPREEILTSYREYVKKFVASLPWPQRSYFRLAYSIL